MIRKKLVILSGPSCVGKGPLRTALRKYHPEIRFGELVLCNSRKPRPKDGASAYEVHGIDYYFLPRGIFAQLDRERFIVAKVRSDIQAIDIAQVRELLQDYDLVLAEAFHTLGRELMGWAKSRRDLDFKIRSVLLVPLSDKEIKAEANRRKVDPEQIVYEVMKAKLERRKKDSEAKIEERARSAFCEMKDARDYTDIIVNHAGEDDTTQWADPLGEEAQRVLDEFVKVLGDC